MYVTAQHVRSPITGGEGVNAFYYLHAGTPALPEVNPGILMRKLVSIDPPGNRIRSYLDMIAPDGTELSVLRYALSALITSCQTFPLPWQSSTGDVLVRFGVDMGLANQWRSELAHLHRAIEAVRFDG